MRAFHKIAFLALLLTSLSAYAQNFSSENLAPYIPTPQLIVEKMLQAGHVTAGDVVYDLGSGDGRVVITAAQKFGAKAVGVEIRPDLVEMAEARIKSLGLEDRVKMLHDSALRVDFSGASVVTMCLLTSSNERLKPNLQRYLKPGSRVVSNEFPIKGWKPVEVVHIKTGRMDHSVFVYEVGHTN
jgi:predicted RNA methylase